MTYHQSEFHQRQLHNYDFYSHSHFHRGWMPLLPQRFLPLNLYFKIDEISDLLSGNFFLRMYIYIFIFFMLNPTYTKVPTRLSRHVIQSFFWFLRTYTVCVHVQNNIISCFHKELTLTRLLPVF